MLFNLLVYLAGWWFGPKALLPLDLRNRRGERRLVGDGRGYTGLAWMLLAAVACSAVQGRGLETLVLACGAQLGTVSLSLLKRARGLAHGAAFRPWDHLDFILGAVLLQALSGGLPWRTALLGLPLCGAVHWIAGGAIKALLEPKRTAA